MTGWTDEWTKTKHVNDTLFIDGHMFVHNKTRRDVRFWQCKKNRGMILPFVPLHVASSRKMRSHLSETSEAKRSDWRRAPVVAAIVSLPLH